MKKIKTAVILIVCVAIGWVAYGMFSSNSSIREEIKEKYEKIKGGAKKSVNFSTDNLEIPAHSKDEDIIVHSAYTTSYNHTTLIPNWVAYELTKSEAEGEIPRGETFMQDPDVKGRQADLVDYKGSGWDRGHMAPAADMKWSHEAMRESFYLSNMCPQNHTLNAGDWERTERMGRRLANEYGNVYIVCGPLFTTNQYGQIGPNHVHVPDAFFKAFLIEKDGDFAAIGFKMDNSEVSQPLKSASMSVDDLEEIIGRDLFPNLPDSIENVIESKIVKKYWGI
jgi:endonuclease G